MLQTNEELTLKIMRSKRAVLRLKFERKLLYERLELPMDETMDGQHPQGDDEDNGAGGAPSSDEGEHVQVKKKRRVRDPNAPRKPLNAFILFSQLERDKMKQARPELSRQEITKELSNIWKEMPEEQKKAGFRDN